MAPLAALTMAGLLFVYSRTSIRAAKLNAQKHREADGGQISWHNESLRRHGLADKVEDDRSTFKEALMSEMEQRKNKQATGVQGKAERAKEEEELRRMMGKDK
jgi:hypothetical protein